jgi:enoyl-CoA hydratase
VAADEEVLLAERPGPALVLTFNRPDKLNAISPAVLRALDRRLEEAERDADVRAVVLTGAGTRAFVAGADIAEYAEADHEAFVRYQAESRRLFSWLDGFGKARGRGRQRPRTRRRLRLALCCDLLVAATNASFGLPEGLLGLSPGGGTQRLTRAGGPFVAADVLVAARRLTAEDAFRLGLVAEVVEPGRLPEAALAKAEQVARVAPLATRAMLALVRTAMEAPLEEGLAREQEALAGLHRTADAAEGIRAFVEKRAPRFTGE